MRQIVTFILFFLTFNSKAQDKSSYAHYNKLTEVEGTEFVIASLENWGKSSALQVQSKYLLFINTLTGNSKQVDFPKDGYVGNIEQIKIDSLGLNLILLSARTVDLDGKSGIDWQDPTQIFIISTNGEVKTQLTDDKFFVRTWTINKKTATIIVAGHYDSNSNGKYDKSDKNQVHIYDLVTLKLISKI